MARDGIPWLRIGCLSIIVLPVLFVLFALAIGQLAPTGDVEERALVQEIPPATGAAVSDDLVETSVPATGLPGRVKLDISGASVFLKAGPVGSPITVQAEYDDESASLREFFDPGAGEGWTYEVAFNGAGDSFVGAVSSMFSGANAKVVVSLPTGTPLALELSLFQGGGQVELGGLWLTTVEVVVTQGGLELDVGDPLAEPLQRFESMGSMGGIQFGSLGNASPRIVEITQRMGGFELDLRGQWREDSEIDISASMSGGALRLPDDVVINGLAGQGVDPQQNQGEGRPVLNVRTRVDMGDVEVIR